MNDLGDKIKGERQRLGWDQAVLAKALGVKQQTVSRWEKGTFTPSSEKIAELASLFSSPVDDWIGISTVTTPDKPVRPLTPVLPISQLSPESFEHFMRDFIQALKPAADVHRFGTQGHKQDGIDVYSDDGHEILGYQVKRHAQFGPKDVEDAINATTFEAQHHHILLGRPASPGARKEINKHSDWSLWDVEDISAKIRRLPPQEKITLIDTYFPGWRSEFLGIENPTPWLSPLKFFEPLKKRGLIFNHTWVLVGRNQEIQSLRAFIDDTGVNAKLLVGRGGVGKSRLLLALTDNLPKGYPVVILAPGVDVNPRDFEQLPSNGLLIIDDAHDYPDLDGLLRTVAIVRPQLKVLMSTRPYGVAKTEDGATSAGFELAEPTRLDDLSVEQATALAVEVMAESSSNKEYASRIGTITKDCPLATVIGARLVAEGKIAPDVLNNSNEFRKNLLKSFRDILAGQLGGATKESEDIKDLLDLISIVQPIDPNEPGFKELSETILSSKFSRTARHLQMLEDAGILIRRKNKLRVVPDLLADYIRAEATYNQSSGTPTGFADEVFDFSQGDFRSNLLVNLGQLDWRLASDGTQSKIIDHIWNKLNEHFLSEKIYGRMGILSIVEKVAYYQPARALDFVHLAIKNPTDEAEEEALRLHKPSYSDVIKKLPPILNNVAHNSEYLVPALDLLRQLARSDQRATNQYPEHPLRLLEELARVEPGKPLLFMEIIVDHVLGWLDEPFDPKFSPFDVLKSVLATEGHESIMRGITLTLKPYRVRADVMNELRKKVIDKAFDTIKSKPAIEAAKATEIISEALQGPWGNDVTDADREPWEKPFLEVLERLVEIVKDTSIDPFIATELRSVVSWHATYSKTATKKAANTVLETIPTDLNYELSRAIADGWGWTFERSERTWGQDETAFTQWRNNIADKVLEEYDNPQDLIVVLEERIKTYRELSLTRHSDPGPFIATLTQRSPEFTIQLVEHIFIKPDGELASMLPIAISVTAQTDIEKSLDWIERCIDSGDVQYIRMACYALGWSMRGSQVGEREMALIERLTQSDDEIARRNIVRATERISDEQKSKAISLLLGIKFSDSEPVAEEVVGEFAEGGKFSAKDLTPSQQIELTKQLIELPDIHDYHIETFLSNLSAVNPELVVNFFMQRVEWQERDPNNFDYHPIPLGSVRLPLKVTNTPQYEKMLVNVRDWTSKNMESWHRHHYGAELFKIVSAGYDETTLKVLDQWVNSPDSKKIEMAANLLSEAAPTFVFSHLDYVINLLSKADKHSEETYKRVASSLFGSMIQGSRTGTPGQPFQEDLYQRDKARSIMQTLPPGSPAYKFFKNVLDHAEANIKRDTRDEEDFLED